MTNSLQETIPPHVRRIAYSAYALLGVALGATQVGFSAAEAGQPAWLIVAMAVYGFVGGAFGVTAAANTHRNGIIGEVEPPAIVIHGATNASPEATAEIAAKIRDREHSPRHL